MHLAPTRNVENHESENLRRIFIGVASLTLALSVLARLRSDLSTTLWLDESWTGAFASQSSLRNLIEQIGNDANAPAYYLFIWVWARFCGLSNFSLHIPSLIFSLITPLIAWAALRHTRPVLALTWAVLLAVWLPAIDQADEARCYALLSCAAVLSTTTHIKLLDDPSLRRASTWAACAGFVTLVHYYAGYLVLAQGLSFIGLQRGRAVRLWPAALIFIPVFACIGWHAPRLADFARTDVAWYHKLLFADLPSTLIFLVGGRLTLISLVMALLVGVLTARFRGQGAPGYLERSEEALWWTGWAALGAAIVCIAMGFARPTFTYRYLTPFAPGSLLLASIWVLRIGRAPHLSSSVLLAGPLVAIVVALALGPATAERPYSFENASAWLAEASPSRLVFFWDHPATPVEAASQLDAVGGFFLRRAGLQIAVTPLYPTSGDMNHAIIKAAGSDAAVLWMYDTTVHHTSARTYPSNLSVIDPGLECQNFGTSNIGVVACRRSVGR